MTVLRAIADLVRVCWRTSPAKLVLAATLMVAQAVALPLASVFLGELTDAMMDGAPSRAVVAALAAAALAMTALTASHFAHVAYFELGELSLLSLERELFRLANASPGIWHHERSDFADRLQVTKQEVDRISTVGTQAFLSSVSLAAAVTLTGVLLAQLSPWLLLLPLLALPPVLCGRAAENRLARARDKAARDDRRAEHMFRLATDAWAAKEVRVYSLQEQIRSRHRDAWQAASRTLWRGEVAAAALKIGGLIVFGVGYLAGTLLVLREVTTSGGTVGDVVLVITLAAQVNAQMALAVNLLREMQRLGHTMGSLRWMRQLIARLSAPDGSRIPPDRLTEGIRFDGVAFTYPGTDQTVIKDVHLTLRPGTSVAIVGENGAGKSTLVKLICRFYDVATGSITVDGVPLDEFAVAEWRGRLTATLQDFARLEFTARESIGTGDLARIDSTEAVTGALHRAQADDLLRRLEYDLNRRLGDSYSDGIELSGGQWQKVALGRAEMRPAPLVALFDEPSSALDAEAEHRLFQWYTARTRRLAEHAGTITVLVSHRFSTVRAVDQIIVVADGRVVETGSHDDLMARDGRYARLYNLQAAQYE
jgi:ATP-binding cassette subfamily B protein